MDEITRTLPATLDYFMGWLRSYVAANREAERQGWRFEIGNRHNYFHEGIQRQRATLTGALAGSRVRLPLVEVEAEEKQRACTVTLRCNEAALAKWFQALALKMVEKWPEVQETESEDGVTAKPIRRRGRLPVDPAERQRICAKWLREQGTTRQDDFCNAEGIAPSTLRAWLKDYDSE